jgi:hypothetical protein
MESTNMPEYRTRSSSPLVLVMPRASQGGFRFSLSELEVLRVPSKEGVK